MFSQGWTLLWPLSCLVHKFVTSVKAKYMIIVIFVILEKLSFKECSSIQKIYETGPLEKTGIDFTIESIT